MKKKNIVSSVAGMLPCSVALAVTSNPSLISNPGVVGQAVTLGRTGTLSGSNPSAQIEWTEVVIWQPDGTPYVYAVRDLYSTGDWDRNVVYTPTAPGTYSMQLRVATWDGQNYDYADANQEFTVYSDGGGSC